MSKISSSAAIAALASFLVSGCSQTSPTSQKSASLSSSQSLEEYREFPNPNVNDNEKRYKARESLSEFTPIAESKKVVMDRANAFCSKSGKKMIVTAEHIIKPPYMINHYPNITITYVCQDLNNRKPPVVKKAEDIKTTNNKYNDLIMIKKLLDEGILTQQEFKEEKRKILNRD